MIRRGWRKFPHCNNAGNNNNNTNSTIIVMFKFELMEKTYFGDSRHRRMARVEFQVSSSTFDVALVFK